MYKVFNVLARIHFENGKNVTLTRKSHVAKKYGYFYWIFTSFHKIVCIVFAMDLPSFSHSLSLALSLCAFVCFCVLSYKLSRRYHVIGEQFKRNACRLSMNMSIPYTLHNTYINIYLVAISRIIWRRCSLTQCTIQCIILCMYTLRLIDAFNSPNLFVRSHCK